MEAVKRLYRARRTVWQMLRDRGYVVSEADLSMTLEEFQERFEDSEEKPLRQQLPIYTKMRDDPEQNIYVFFLEGDKVGVERVKPLLLQLLSENVRRAILVLQGQMSAFALQSIQNFENEQEKTDHSTGIRIERFDETELQVNITQHVLVPQHTVLSQSEKKNLLQRYRITDDKLPKIQINDPVARYYGMERKQVVEIIRPSETAGRYVNYRLCV